MHKQRRKICAGITLLAILTVLAVIINRPVEEGTNEAEEEREYLIAEGNGEIEKIVIDNKEGTFEIHRGQDGFAMEGMAEEALDEDKLNETVTALRACFVEENLGEKADLEQFGLGRKAVLMEIIFRGGGTEEWKIGDEIEGSGRRYVLHQNEVCIVSDFPASLPEGRKAFYRLLLISIPQEEDENGAAEDRLDYLRLSGRNFERAIVIRPSGETNSGYLMEEPVYSEAMFVQTDVSLGTVSVIDSLGSVAADSVEAERISGKEALYGLEEPYAKVEYRLNGEAHEICIGEEVRGGKENEKKRDTGRIFGYGFVLEWM